MTGAAGLTVIINDVVLVPAVLVAVIVKVAVGNTKVGVPEITPVEVLNDNPVGSIPVIA